MWCGTCAAGVPPQGFLVLTLAFSPFFFTPGDWLVPTKEAEGLNLPLLSESRSSLGAETH